MSFGDYLRSCIWELALCILASCALTYTAFSAFYATQPLQQVPWVIVVFVCCAFLSAVLFGIAYETRIAAIGGVSFAVVVAVIVAVCASVGPAEMPLDDVEGNYAIAVLVLVAMTTLVFLLSRTHLLCVVLLIVGIWLCGLVEYLYWYGHIWAALIFLLACAALIIVKGYRNSLAKADAGSVAFTPVALTGLALAALSLACAAGVFVLVVQPLNPPNVIVKLIVETRSQEQIDILGTGASTADEGGNRGNLANGEQEESNNQAEQEQQDTVASGELQLRGMDDDQTGNDGSTTALPRELALGILAVLLIALLVAAIIVIRKYMRRRHYERMIADGNENGVKRLYLFFLERFARMKMPRPETSSLAEFARANVSLFNEFEQPARQAMQPTVAGGGGDPAFSKLTDLYERVVYGHEKISNDEFSAFTDYYRGFYKNARHKVGAIKYLYKFFRL